MLHNSVVMKLAVDCKSSIGMCVLFFHEDEQLALIGGMPAQIKRAMGSSLRM